MILSHETAALKNGEKVELSLMKTPDAIWGPRIEKILGHKSAIWHWQNEKLLNHECGVDAYYYFLHRGDAPFSNIMVAEVDGIAMLAHVWTSPEERGKGAAQILMVRHRKEFAARKGRFMILGTDFDTQPYRIYMKSGFLPFEDGSGQMFFCPEGVEAFENQYYAPGQVIIEEVDWKQYLLAPLLFLRKGRGVIRSAALGIMNRYSTEAPLIHVLMDRYAATDAVVRAKVLRSKKTGAVVGLAAWDWDKTWKGNVVVDVFCHEAFWKNAAELLASLDLPKDRRLVAYADPTCPEKKVVFEKAGFKQIAVLPQWARSAVVNKPDTDVIMLVKNA